MSPVKGRPSSTEDNDVTIAMYIRHLQVAQAKQSHAEESAAKLQAAVGHVTVRDHHFQWHCLDTQAKTLLNFKCVSTLSSALLT